MSDQQEPTNTDHEGSKTNDFEEASKRPPPSLVREFVEFLGEEKKWWIAPILIVLGLLMLVAVLANSPAAPFIYSLF